MLSNPIFYEKRIFDEQHCFGASRKILEKATKKQRKILEKLPKIPCSSLSAGFRKKLLSTIFIANDPHYPAGVLKFRPRSFLVNFQYF